MVLAVIGLLVSLAIPRYQDYLTKAALSTTFAQASAEKLNVELFISENGQFPAALTDDISFNQGQINYKPTTNNQGEIIASITSGAAQGSTLSLIRDLEGEWQCVVTGSDNLESQLPKSCTFTNSGS